jgi:hypothetical protein
MVNVDAALFAEFHRMAMGVFRDHNGGCLLVASEPLTGFTSPELAEAMALRRATAIAADQGFDRIIFGSDCLSLIQQLQSTGQDRSEVGSVVLDIKHMVVSFSSSIFRHVHRFTNGAAHIVLFLFLFRIVSLRLFVPMWCD